MRAGMSSPIFSAAGRIPITKSFTKAKRSIRSKSTLILPEVLDESKWYEGQAPLHRPGAKPCLYLHRQSIVLRILLQHDFGEPEGIQILLGSGRAQMERQIRFPGSAEHGSRRLVCSSMYYHPELGDRNLSNGCSATCSRPWDETGGKLPTGWRKENLRFASVAAIPRRQKARDCRSMSSTTSTGKKESSLPPAAAR